jgi:hypothetical protein
MKEHMSDAKIRAEAILIVIKKILKWIGLSFVCVGLLIFLAYLYEQYEAKQSKEIEDKVSIRAFHPKEGPCSKDFPYQYVVFNESGRVVEKVTFTVRIKRSGFSSDINRYTSISEDKIIQNEEGWGRCFRAEDANQYGKNLTEKDVDIVIDYKDVKFKD